MLTHERDRRVLERFVGGPRLSGEVLLLRHARAGERSEWEGDDRRRPLDDEGWDQAEELVRMLSRFDVEEIVSADFDRCVQTVQPLADATGVPIVPDRLFAEDGYPGREAEAVERVRKLAQPGRTALVCTQRAVIPDLLRRLVEEDHVELATRFRCRKGAFWALAFDGPRLFTAEYFPPPRIDPGRPDEGSHPS